jgi:protein gp37
MKDSKIEWTDGTINPTSGCDGCELYRPAEDGSDAGSTCYAKEVHLNRLAKSYPYLYAPRFDEVRMIEGRMKQAADWPDLTGKERKDKPWLNGLPRHIFVGDMGDVFSAAVTMEFIKREVVGAAESKDGKRHVWQWLSKRPERMAELSDQLGGLPDNVVAMTTVTNQRTADVRIPHLLRVKAKTRGLSIEPMRGAVRFSTYTLRTNHCFVCACEDKMGQPRGTQSHPINCLNRTSYKEAKETPAEGIDWVICGGESGPKARPMHPDWARSLRDQCQAAGVAFFFKQWGEWAPTQALWKNSALLAPNGKTYPNDDEHPDIKRDYPFRDHRALLVPMTKMGKAEAGRLLDGREWNELPSAKGGAA